jgi:hypothetical protein
MLSKAAFRMSSGPQDPVQMKQILLVAVLVETEERRSNPGFRDWGKLADIRREVAVCTHIHTCAILVLGKVGE